MRNVVLFDALGPSVAMAGLCVCVALVPDWATQGLAWDRHAIGAGELWRLWTGHIVHYSLRHALLDASAVMLLGCAAEMHFGKRFVFVALLLGAPLMSVALLVLFPDMLEYRGASGLATFLGVLTGVALWRSKPRCRGLLAMLAALFIVKMASDAWGLQTTFATLPRGVNVAWQVHLLGIAVAVAVWYGNLSFLVPRSAASKIQSLAPHSRHGSYEEL